MKSINKFFTCLLVILIAGYISYWLPIFHKALADTGWQGAQRVEVGNYTNTTATVMSTTASTLIADVNVKRPDLTCFNNSSATLWISSNTAGTSGITIGFPILSSTTFKLGAYVGQVYGTLTSGSGDVRCWQGLVQ